MAIDLKADQVQKLVKAGVPSSEIRQYQLSKANSTINSKIDSILRSVPSRSGGGGTFGTSPKVYRSPQDTYKRSLPKSNYSGPSKPSGPGGRTYDIPGGPKGSLNPDGTVKKPTGPVARYPAPSSLIEEPPYDPMSTYPGLEEGPAFPDLGNIEIPIIAPKDFMPDAQRISDGVFAPLFESLASSKKNIGQQGERSRQVLSGLYQNMVNDIATSAAQTHQQYEQQKTDVGQRGQALQQGIGAGYQSSQQNIGDIAQKLGLQAAAPEALQASANDQAWQQGMAGQGTTAMQNYLGAQQQGEANLNTNRQDVARTSGAVAQENNLNQVAQLLAGVDAQSAGYQSDKARTALDIAQNLTSQDLSAQQANAGYQMQGQSAQQDALLKAWQAANEATNQRNQYNTGRWGAEQSASDAAWQRQMDQAKLDLDRAALEQKSQGTGSSGASLDDYTGVGKARASLFNQYGEAGTHLADTVMNIASMSDGFTTGDRNLFMQDVFKQKDPRYTDDQWRNAAYTMWEALRNK